MVIRGIVPHRMITFSKNPETRALDVQGHSKKPESIKWVSDMERGKGVWAKKCSVP